MNIRDGTIECPAGQVEQFEPGAVVHFDPEACGPCPIRASCMQASSGSGRSVPMGEVAGARPTEWRRCWGGRTEREVELARENKLLRDTVTEAAIAQALLKRALEEERKPRPTPLAKSSR